MPKLSRRELCIGTAAGTVGGVAGIAAYRGLRGLLAGPTSPAPPSPPVDEVLGRFPPSSTPSFAHSGEDVMARLFLNFIGKPSYLDIGAYLPIFGNNTYLFYAMGGRGVLVEPNVAI